MQRGEFFEQFFSERGNFSEKANGEINVLCPFPHDKGLETRPSAHVNLAKGLFHCQTCHAEGRFDSGGMSEVSFASHIYGISYEEAIQLFEKLEQHKDFDKQAWSEGEARLWAHPEYAEYLQGSERGLTLETIKEYHLASMGDGIAYPITIHGQLCDVRTYMPHEHPKMRSQKGASALLFPFDHWLKDKSDYTLLCAGENDCLLARQNGFNALTVTAGEWQFPKMFGGQFKGKKVYICYDCDKAGKEGGTRVAFHLFEAGADVYIVDIGLPGTKESKDITDFFMREGKSNADLYQCMANAVKYSPEDFAKAKNVHYPLVDLWDTAKGKYSGKRVSSRVILSGSYDQVMHSPTAVEWKCRRADPESKVCLFCPLKNKSGWWTLSDTNIKDVMELVDVTEKQQTKTILNRIRMPDECPNGEWHIRARQEVRKVIFTPDVETEGEGSGFRSVEQYAYTIGLNLEEGEKYRAFFRTYSHPLDGQRVFMLVDRVEASDNSLNTFQVTPDIIDQLKIFQGDPFEIMTDRAERMHDITKIFEPNPMIANAVNIMYHSPLRFNFNGREMKGYPEGLIVGESRTGKTETGLFFQQYIGVGNKADLKGATTAALLGGADKMANGGWKVQWGLVPRNHKGLVLMDEMSDMNPGVMASLTAMRSERKATVQKIARGTAPAETRLLWTGNPKKQANGQSKNIRDYASGVDVVMELVGADEDVARFDFCIIILKSKDDSSPLDEPKKKAYPAEAYRNLVYWVWSRTADQIKFDEGVELYIVQIAKELNEKYDTDVKFLGAEAWKKLARIAVACAGATFSCTDGGEQLVCTKQHVDWAASFLRQCYDNPIFRLADYVRERRSYNETNEAVNTKVAGLCRTQTMMIKALLEQNAPIRRFDLEAVANLEPDKFKNLLSQMSRDYLVKVSTEGVSATRRLRLAVQAFKEDYAKSKMIPLTEQ